MKRIQTSVALMAALLLLSTPSLAQEDEPGGSTLSTKPAKPKGSLRKVFKILRKEASIRKVHHWALTHYKLEPERMHALARNARLKGLIPQVQVSMSNQFSSNLRNTRDGLYPLLPDIGPVGNPESYKERETGRSEELGWSVNATWTLDRLAFNGEALDAKSLTSLEENLIREVTTIFYSRRRIIASLLMSPPENEEELFYEVMRLDEMTATLDAFTGAKFGKDSWDWEKELLPKGAR